MATDTTTGMTILDPDVCWNLLRSAEVARLAVSIMDQPDIFPINFVVDRRTVVFRTAEGTKLAAAVLGRGVALEPMVSTAAPGKQGASSSRAEPRAS